jgi:intein/homing endonuclease
MNGDRTIRKLETNIYLYVIEGVFVIGPSNTCKCLPNTARILTSQGEEKIDNLQIGDSVYTFNNIDGKILAPIIQVIKTPVQKEYIMIKITLEEGRSVQASSKHPIPIERKYANSSVNQFEELLFSDIKKGDHIDNSKVVSIEFVKYNGEFTYDILPAGESGYYWADEVLIGSTLFHNYVSELGN